MAGEPRDGQRLTRARLSLYHARVQKVIPASEMREIDRLTTEAFATPSLLLMESAARAAATEMAKHFPDGMNGKAALILCGRGNNGGDGAALARILCLMGARVDVVLFGRVEDSKGDARTNFEIARSLSNNGAKFKDDDKPDLASLALHDNSDGSLMFTECETLEAWEKFLYEESEQDYEVIVDALFGTGLTRPLEGVQQEAVRFMNRQREVRQQDKDPLIISLDIPSGLDADSAVLIGEAVEADLTITFTAPKPANVLPPASHKNGQLVVANIGSPVTLLDESPSQLFVTERVDARRWLIKTRYAPDSYKNTHGHALVIAGSRGYTGAAVLAGDATMRAGAGLVTVATPASAQAAVAARTMPEVMTAPLAETDRGAASDEAIEHVLRLTEKASVVAIGPGLTSDDERTRRFVREVIERRQTPVVIDADGLNALAPWPEELRGSAELPLILTPHAGEMLRLVGAFEKDAIADRVLSARKFATKHQVILVLKGARTLVATPDGRVFVNPTGNAGLGTAGAGDTLTGIITGFNAQAFATLKDEADAVEATVAAVYVGGMAGDIAARARGMRTMVASDIREHLSAAICALDPQGEQP
jgi:NAD(P)H-hydrate epimerase